MDEQVRAGLKQLRLAAHPLRLRLLSLLTGTPMSAAEAARELGQTQANVSYHIRQLAAGGLIRLVDEKSVRGGTAKRYVHDPVSGETVKVDHRDGHMLLIRTLAEQMNARAAISREGSNLVFTDAHVSIPISQWSRVESLARELGRLVHELAEFPSTENVVNASVTVAVFETE